MRKQLVSGGASVGLSALLAGLLLVAARPDSVPEPAAPSRTGNEAAAPAPVNKRGPADAPTVVVLPEPPRKPVQRETAKRGKADAATARPPTVAKVEVQRPIVPMRPSANQPAPVAPVEPMRPSPEAPNPAATEPPAANKAAAVIDAVSEEATDDTVVAMVRPGEDAAVADQGRVLLRMLEHGRGPAVELAWPARAVDRERLYRVFRDCLGMRVALRDAAGRLFVRESPPGQPWQPNVDRYSGFARQPTGRLAAAERRDIRAIGRRHGLSRRAAAIRVFPRRVDALLLGGLSRLVGDGYADARSIRASYRLADGVVAVVGVQVDGRPVAGGVELGAAANTSCRSG